MVNVIWQENAINHLQSIFHYYYENASIEVAARILVELQNAPDVLEIYPHIGQEEATLSHLQGTYRYLVVRKRYKIIYLDLGETCHILAIWDVRQNPNQLSSVIFD